MFVNDFDCRSNLSVCALAYGVLDGLRQLKDSDRVRIEQVVDAAVGIGTRELATENLVDVGAEDAAQVIDGQVEHGTMHGVLVRRERLSLQPVRDEQVGSGLLRHVLS